MTTTRLPALGLDDTAARILAACAAREPLQVDPWEARLPAAVHHGVWANDRCASALSSIANAMVSAGADARGSALTAIRLAAAEVRAWRLSLPESQQGDPVVLVTPPGTARVGLRLAIRCLCDADVSVTVGAVRGRHIRYAEAYLRTVGEALIAQGAK